MTVDERRTPPPEPEPTGDRAALGRRGFIRALGGETLRSAAALAGVTETVRREASGAGSGLGDVRDPAVVAGTSRALRGGAGRPAAGSAPFRSLYRVDGDILCIDDQWRLP